MKKTFFIATNLLAIAGCAFWIQSCHSNKSKTNEQRTLAGAFIFREKLSEYGFFKGDLKNLLPAEGLVRYELNTPLFTDYTIKDRFILLPQGKTIQYDSINVFNFPDSTIIIKNFAYRNSSNQKTLIETRLLVKDPAEKVWKVMNYLWDSTQTDAVKHIIGAKIPITLLDDDNKAISTVYQVPTTNDCKRCHYNSGSLIPIGPKARNLNLTLADHSENQLTEWANLKKISGLPSIEQLKKLPDWKDAAHFSLDERARAYLDINCAHCHTNGGDATNTGLFLEYQQTDRQHLGILKSPVSAGGGAGGLNYDIVPGDAAHSIFIYRMNSTEAGTAMPELARTIVHKEAVKLIVDWINEMKEHRSFNEK